MARQTLVAASLVALCLTGLAWVWKYPESKYPFRVEVMIDASTRGFCQLYFDRGAGLNESDSTTQPLNVGRNLIELPLPAGAIRFIRFDPIDRNGTAKFGPLRITGPGAKTIRLIAPNQLAAAHQIAETREEGGLLAIATTPNADDPQFSLTFEPPLELSFTWRDRLYHARYWILSRYCVAFLLCLLVQATWRYRAAEIAWWKTLARDRPRLALALCATLAAVLSSYPVVFFGRSFVSPNTTALLYNSVPSVPGVTDTRSEDARGADVGAMLWQHYSYTVQQHRALLAGDLPLWNRFVACGVTLFGQGQSMLGDPLHLLVVLANGASWAFDLKFVLAKALFACGIGWCVWWLTRDFPAAAIATISAAFIALFNYRLNHPSLFTLGYAPWILVAWLQLQNAVERRSFHHALLLWYVANWMVLTSGTVKEAYLLALTLNLTGALIFFTGSRPTALTLRRAGLLVLAGIAFVLVSAPLWRTFLDALHNSYTSYDTPLFVQMPGQWLIGLFDDIFYREFTPYHYVYKPAANFLVLLGCLWAVLQPRRLFTARAPLFVLLGAVGALALAFRFGPPSWAPHWVLAIPFLRNVVNLDTIFSYVAIVHLCVLAGWGYAAARQPLVAGKALRYGCGMLAVVLFLFAVYVFIRPDNFAASHVWPAWKQLSRETALLCVAAILLPVAAWILTLVASRRLRTGRLSVAGFVFASVALVLLLGRHGQHLRGVPTTYVAAPGPRADLQARSSVVEDLRQRTRSEPGRILGLERCLFPGFASSYGLEFIFGANALDNRWYRQFAEASGLVLPTLWIFETSTGDLPKWRPFADFLNVRFLAAPAGVNLSPSALKPVATLDLNVFENEHAWPRAFFADHLETYGDPADLVRKIRQREGQRPFAAIQDGEVIPPSVRNAVDHLVHQPAATVVAPARGYLCETNATSFTVEAPGPGVAVLQETWLPDDFIATVNGALVPYLRINHAFKAVVLPQAGSYRIEFRYWPATLTSSLILWAIGLGLVVISLWLCRQAPAPSEGTAP